MPYIIASIIEKGGAGKTTTAIHLAEALARTGRRVLIAELDPQKNATKWIGPETEPPRSMLEVLQRPDLPLDDAIAPTLIPNVDILSGARALGMPERFLTVDHTGNPQNQFEVLKRALEQVPASYDTVFIDCPPSVGVLNTNAIVAADRLLISMDPSELTYDGFANLAMTLGQMQKNRLLARLPAISVLYTIWDGRWKVAKRVQQRVEKAPTKPYHVFRHAIRNRVVLRNLPQERATAFGAAEASARDVAADYERVGTELLELIAADRAAVPAPFVAQ